MSEDEMSIGDMFSGPMDPKESGDPLLTHLSYSLDEYVERHGPEGSGVVIATPGGVILGGEMRVNSDMLRAMAEIMAGLADLHDDEVTGPIGDFPGGSGGEVKVKSRFGAVVPGYVIPHADAPREDHEVFQGWLRAYCPSDLHESQVGWDTLPGGETVYFDHSSGGDMFEGTVVLANGTPGEDGLNTEDLRIAPVGVKDEHLESLLVVRDHFDEPTVQVEDLIALCDDESVSDEVRTAARVIRKALATEATGKAESMPEVMFMVEREEILEAMAKRLGRASEHRPGEDKVLNELLDNFVHARVSYIHSLGRDDLEGGRLTGGVIYASELPDLIESAPIGELLSLVGMLVEVGVLIEVDENAWTLTDSDETFHLWDGSEVQFDGMGMQRHARAMANMVESIRTHGSIRDGYETLEESAEELRGRFRDLIDGDEDQTARYMAFLDTYPWLGEFAPILWMTRPPLVDPEGIADEPPEGYRVADYTEVLSAPVEMLMLWCEHHEAWESMEDPEPMDPLTWRFLRTQDYAYALPEDFGR